MKFKPLQSSGAVHGVNPRPYTVGVDDAMAAVADLKARPDIDYAEPNYIITAETMPDDWGYDPTDWAVVDLPLSWGYVETRAPLANVRMAVLDTGVDIDHPELVDALMPGYNFINDTEDVDDDTGHGTRICGIIGARGNNGAGVAGVAWNAPIEMMPVRVMESAGIVSAGSVAHAVQGIYYAVDNGARIITACWGFSRYSRAMKDAIAYALDHEVLFVCSAGNESADNDVVPHYPSNYNLDNIVSVAAMTKYGRLAGFSNFGSYGVHIAAPGEGLRTADLDGQFNWWVYGTSYAAAFVSGVAALILAENPALGVGELRLRILQGSVISDELSEEINACGGCVNAYNALLGIMLHAITDTHDWTPPVNGGVAVPDHDDGGACLIVTAAGPENTPASWLPVLAAIIAACPVFFCAYRRLNLEKKVRPS